MAPYNVKLNVGRLSAVETIALTRQFVSSLTGHDIYKDPLPPYLPSLQLLTTKADRLEGDCHAAANRDLGMIAIKNKHCQDLKTDLKAVKKYVELAANGDETILQGLGVPIARKKAKVKTPTIPPSPVLTVKYGSGEGSLICYVAKGYRSGSSEVFIAEGDPNVEGNWKLAATFSGAQFELTGYQPGTRYWLRARSIGPGGPGPWSPPFPIMAH